MDYVSIQVAQALSGLRLVLSTGVPGPWGEAAKGLFEQRGVSYVPVAQIGGNDNEELISWTGIRNALQAIFDGEPVRTKWDEILALAERLGSGASLVPECSDERSLMYGIIQDICGEGGFGWHRRLEMLHPQCAMMPSDDPQVNWSFQFARRYGYMPGTVAYSNRRVCEILTALGSRLVVQESQGSPYLVGANISAADIYWACFAFLIVPLCSSICIAPDFYVTMCSDTTRETRAVLDRYPALIRHRDMMYAKHLKTPLDF